jgi:hypothetical protein
MRRQRVIALVLLSLFTLVMIGGGVFIITVQQRGTPAEATVTECHRQRRSTTCTGTWVVGGELTEGGQLRSGTIEGADSGDIGKTLAVRLSGNRAYTTSLRLPLILIGIGAVAMALAVWQHRSHPARPRPYQAPPSAARPAGPPLAGAPPPGAAPPLRPPPPGLPS